MMQQRGPGYSNAPRPTQAQQFHPQQQYPVPSAQQLQTYQPPLSQTIPPPNTAGQSRFPLPPRDQSHPPTQPLYPQHQSQHQYVSGPPPPSSSTGSFFSGQQPQRGPPTCPLLAPRLVTLGAPPPVTGIQHQQPDGMMGGGSHPAGSIGSSVPQQMMYGSGPFQTAAAFARPSAFGGVGTPTSYSYAVPAQAQSDPNLEKRAQEAQVNNPYPHLAQATTLRLPNSGSLNQKAHIPLAVVFRPLAATPEGVSSIPFVNFGTGGKVIRCSRCRTYINPFVEWEANGRRWVCNLCSYSNETPQAYYCGLDETGRRMDRLERPELSRSSVEFIAPDDYMVRPPQPPTYMFLIDVSAGAVASGVVGAACEALKTAIQSNRLPGGARTQIGIATFDNTVHFYNLDPNLSQPQMLVMPDLKDCFLPLAEGILVLACEAQQMLVNLLDSLPGMWINQRVAESCMGSAVKAMYVAMKHIGGKISLFTSTVPLVGEFVLSSQREISKVSASGESLTANQQEAEVLRPAKQDYSDLANYLSQAQLSIDIYACVPGNQQIDLATLAPLATRTGGDLHYLPMFNAHLHGQRLREELIHSLTREQAWEALVRFRVSKGWNIATWYGHFLLRRPDLLVLPCGHADQTFTVMLSMQDNVVPDPLVFVQSALLYTNSDGERRIRVLTYCLAVTHNLTDLVAAMNVSVTSYVIGQQAIEQATTRSLTDARSYVQTVCSQIVQAIQSDRPGASSATHGSASRLLPLYILGLLKSPILREAKDISNDLRIYHWNRLMSLPIESAIALFYPRMISIHDLKPIHGTRDESMHISLPDPVNLSASSMVEEGVYLLEDGESMLLWISRGVPSQWLRAVFGAESIDQLQPEYSETLIGTTGDNFGSRVAMIINSIQQERKPSFMKLSIIRQGDPNEYKFFCSVIEDRNHALMMSYADFLQKLGPRVGMTQPAIARAQCY